MRREWRASTHNPLTPTDTRPFFFPLQLHPPTGVTHATSLRWTAAAVSGAAPPDVVTATGTRLCLYAVRVPGDDDDGGGGGASTSTPHDTAAARLELVLATSLAGVIESLAVLPARLGGGGGVQRDGLVATFRDAKAIVLDYDDATNEARPTSLHALDGGVPAAPDGRVVFARPPVGAADPEGRAAVAAFHSSRLAVLPALEADELDALLEGGGTTTSTVPATVGNAAVFDLASHGVADVRSLAFLHGAAAPTLAVLHTPRGLEGATWAGNAAARPTGGDGASVCALALDAGGARPPARLWTVTDLPADAYTLTAAPGGGLLILCRRLVLWIPPGGGHGAPPPALALSPAALPAPAPPPRIHIDSMKEVASETAARHARTWASRLNPHAAPSAAARAAPPPPGLDADACGAAVAWLADGVALLALASGQLVVVRVERGARGGGGGATLSASRAGAASPATTLATVGPGLAFLGSWSGDSLLLAVTTDTGRDGSVLLLGDGVKGGDAGAAGDGSTPPPAKRARTLAGAAPTPLADEDDDEGVKKAEAPVKKDDDDGDGAVADADDAAPDAPPSTLFRVARAAPLPTIDPDAGVALRVVDAIPSTGPVRAAALCDAPPAPPGARAGASPDPPLLLAAVGTGSSGALLATRRSVAAEIVTEVPLPGLATPFAVHLVGGVGRHREAAGGADASSTAPRRGACAGEPRGYHDALLLSMSASTKVLAAGDALDEVTDGSSGFETAAPTLAAAALRGGAAAVQVTPSLVRLVPASGGPPSSLSPSDLGLASGAPLVAGAACGEWVAVHDATGSAALARLDASASALTPVPAPRLAASPPVTAITVFDDAAGWFSEGGADSAAAAVARGDGALELWALSASLSPRLVARYAGLADGARVLLATDAPPAFDVGAEGAPPPLVELCVVTPSRARRDGAPDPDAPPVAPLLLTLAADGDVVAWRASRRGGGRGPPPAGAPRPRWARLDLGLPPAAGAPAPAPGASSPPRFIPFTALGDAPPRSSGVFLCGSSPTWLVSSRGSLVPHPDSGGPSSGFAPFHNVNCVQGFLTASPGAAGGAGGLRVGGLPRGVRLDTPWPTARVPLGAVPTCVAWHAPSRLWAVGVHRPRAPPRGLLPAIAGGDPAAAWSYAAADVAASDGLLGVGEVRLIHPGAGGGGGGRWATAWRHAVHPGERVTAAVSVALSDGGPGTPGPLLPFIAVGTAFGTGEDAPAWGRVLLVEVRREGVDGAASAVPPVGAAPLSGPGGAGWEASIIYSRELRGPVTCVSSLDGALIVAYGSRVEGHAWADGRLTRTAFHDAPTTAVAALPVKNFVLVADAHRGLRFLHAINGVKNLIELAREFDAADGTAAGYMVCGRRLALVLADGGGALRVASYDASHPDAWRGKRLVPLAAIHVGAASLAAASVRGGAVKAGGDDASTPPPRVQACLLPRVDGGVGMLLPLSDAATAATLAAVSAAATTGLAAPGGLHARAFRDRALRVPRALGGGARWGKPAAAASGGVTAAVVDGDLLARWADAPRAARERVASRAGVSAHAARAAVVALSGAWGW